MKPATNPQLVAEDPMRIFWPYQMALPVHAYGVLNELHEGDQENVKVNCPRRICWRDANALAEYLQQHRDREGWVYTLQHPLQIELAARTGLPFRVFDFFTPKPNASVEVAAVIQVQGRDREVIWVNPFFSLAEAPRNLVHSATAH